MLQLVCDIQLCRSRLFDSAQGEWEVQFVHTKIIQTHKKKATQSNILRDFCDDDISHWPGLNVRLSEHAAINMENLVSEKVALSARMHFNFHRVRCLAVVVCRKKCIFCES